VSQISCPGLGLSGTGQQSTLKKCGAIELYYTNSNPNPNLNLNPDPKPKPNPIFILQLLYS